MFLLQYIRRNTNKFVLWKRFYQIFMATIKPTFPLWFNVSILTPIFGLLNDPVSNIRLINYILWLFKLYIYKSRNKHRLNINELLADILKIRKLVKVTAFCNVKKVAAYNKKWDITYRKLPLQSKVRFTTFL